MERCRGRLSRRQFVSGAAGLGMLAGCGRLPWQAQEPAKAYRIGGLAVEPWSDRWDASVQSLRDYGYVEGRNIFIEFRSAELVDDRLPALAAELVQIPVDVIVTAGTQSNLAAARATRSIPIVIVTGDPIRDGLAVSLARPGGNVTGLSRLAAPLGRKRLELLKETIPGASRIGVLWTTTNPAAAAQFREAQVAAQILGVDLISLEIRFVEDLGSAFETSSREGADALLVVGDTLTYVHAAQIAALAAESQLPAIHEGRDFAVDGGLMAYGPSLPAAHRRIAYYVDRILKGAKPADLPVEQPMTFDFVVNMKTAQALGITFPNEIMLQVTEVVQ